jgi:hypothetical protein
VWLPALWCGLTFPCGAEGGNDPGEVTRVTAPVANMCVVTAVAVCGWGRVAIEQQWHAGAVFATAMVVRVALAYSDCCDNPLMTSAR